MKILTFDIEDWFHILDLPLVEDPDTWDHYESRIEAGTQRLLDLLEEENVSATFFIIGWVAERYPALVRMISDRGYEIGSHSYHHRLVYKMDRNSFSEDLNRSVTILQDVIGQPVRLYRAPGFSITPDCVWAFDALVQNGIEIDCSIFAAPRRHGGFPDIQASEPFQLRTGGTLLKELPMSFTSVLGKSLVYSGGGYFRLLPSHVINVIAQRQDYVMTYFHPRDFDPGQPRLPMSKFRTWQTYVGLNGALEKLRMLVRSHEFSDIRNAEHAISWEDTPIFDVSY